MPDRTVSDADRGVPETGPSGLYDKVRRIYEEGGVHQLALRGAKKLGRFIFHTNRAAWFRMSLAGEVPSFTVPEGISLEFDDREGAIRYIREQGYCYAGEIETGLAEGHLYTGLKYRGEWIGYNKMGFAGVYIQDFRRRYQFPPGAAYTYDVFVAPEHRGRGQAAFLLGEVCRRLKEMGYRSVWAHIPLWNVASEKMHRKLGFERQRVIAYYSIAGVSWTTVNPAKYIEAVEHRHGRDDG